MENTAAQAPKLPRLSPSENPNCLVGSLQSSQPWMHAGRNRAETGRKLGNQTTTKHDTMFALFFCYLKPDVPHGFKSSLSSPSTPRLSTLQALCLHWSPSLPSPIRQSYSNDYLHFPHHCCQYLIELRRCAVSQHAPPNDFNVLKTVEQEEYVI